MNAYIDAIHLLEVAEYLEVRKHQREAERYCEGDKGRRFGLLFLVSLFEKLGQGAYYKSHEREAGRYDVTLEEKGEYDGEYEYAEKYAYAERDQKGKVVFELFPLFVLDIGDKIPYSRDQTLVFVGYDGDRAA